MSEFPTLKGAIAGGQRPSLLFVGDGILMRRRRYIIKRHAGRGMWGNK